MSQEPSERPYGGSEGGPSLGSPHLADYWQVISRRLWLVLLIFGVTTASAIWAVSRQQTFYQAHLSLRVNDPFQPARGLVTGTRVSGMDIYVDPIESEIQVLKANQIARQVVQELGLRVVASGEGLTRSDLAREIQVDPEAPTGRYELVYDAGGRAGRLENAAGELLGEAAVGEVLEAGFLRFVLQPPPGESRVYRLDVVETGAVVGEVSNNLTASPRENTNIIDVYFLSGDQALAPRVLNTAAQKLRDAGARRVSREAEADLSFIEARLDSVRQQRQAAAQQIQNFKQTRDFTNLSAREQNLLDRTEQVNSRIQSLEDQRIILSDLARQLDESGGEALDLAPVLAVLPEGTSPQIQNLINRLREQQSELRRLLIEDQLAPGHPQVRAVRREIEERSSDLIEATRARVRVIENQLAELRREESELRSELSAFPDLQNRLDELQQQKALVDDTYQFLLSQLFQAEIVRGGVTPYVEIIDPAFGASPIQPRGRVNVFLGALLGIILGVGAAFFLEYLDRTVRTSSDVESLLGIPVLGVIPRLRPLEEEEPVRGKGAPLVVAMDPLDPAAEAYRNLRMNLMFMSTEESPIRCVLFSSPGPDEGKSTTAVNFAVMLAQQGQRVLLVDADLRRPALHRSLDLLREPGLTNLLIGDAETREAIRPNVLPNLDVLPSGPFPPNPSELLNSKAMERLLEEFEGKYSQIIIDSPPVLAVTDSAVLATHTDGVVLVLRSGETEQRAAERSVDQLRRLGVRVFGAVLNEVSTTTSEENYYLQYYYSYTPSSSGWDRLREGLTRARFW